MAQPYPRQFPEEVRRALYDVIYARRDIRSQFRPDPIPDDVLWRILDAAHHAGSVGFMQPWNFLVIRDRQVRQGVHEIFLRENERAAQRFTGERAELYRGLKLEGILETPLNLCVTCDRERHGPEVLGRNTMRDTDLYSTCCAIQNLWLAARAEGIGVGWVSILDPNAVRDLLGVPESHQLVAWLCMGYVESFPGEPELQSKGWLKRLPLQQVIFEDRWQQPARLRGAAAEEEKESV